MKKLIAILALVVSTLGAGLSLSACHAPATIVTQPGKTAFAADQIVVRVNELEKAVIQAEASGGLPTAQARVLVGWSVSADKILKATPAGWRATLVASWTEAKKQAPSTTNPTVAAAIAAVDLVLGGI